MGAHFEIVRIYDAADDAGTGRRVLVDRLWPRGVTREAAALDEWLKEVAPSTALRRWYGHEPARFVEFSSRYRAELAASPAAEAVDHLLELAARQPVVLVTATRDVERSGARVLCDHLRSRAGAA